MNNNQSDKKIKAVWLASWYPHAGQTTLGIFTRRDAEAVALYCEVAIISALETEVKKFQIENVVTSKGIREVQVRFPQSPPNLRILRLIRRTIAFCKGYSYLNKKGFTPQLIHLHVIFPAGLAALWLYWWYNLPLFISEHWSGYGSEKMAFSGFQKWLAKLCTSRATIVLTVTQAMANAMLRCGLKGNYIVNPNVVDTSFRSSGNLKTEQGEFRFIHVSSLDDSQKNISGLLRAVKILCLARQDFSVLIVGGDKGTTFFEKTVIDLGIEGFVQFTGVLPHQQVMQKFAESDAFVLFSTREGLPCVLLEAMAVGLPVISTRLPGLDDWVTPETGILVRPGDEDGLAAAMNDLMERQREFDPQKIRKIIVANCSYEVVGKKIASLYRQAISNQSSLASFRTDS